MSTRWSIEEETLLADMWLEISRNSEGLNERSFWDRVVARFNEWTDGDHRNKSMITGKWARLSCECCKCHDIYHYLQQTSQDPEQNISTALNMFRERYGRRGFQYLHVWLILKNTQEWARYV